MPVPPSSTPEDPDLRDLRAALKSRKAEARLAAIRRLARMEGPEVDALLIQAMRDRLSLLGAVAARALARRATPEIADAMVDHFLWASEKGVERDPGCSVRVELARVFGELHHYRAENALRTGIRTVQKEMVGFGLEDTAIAVRGECALALAQIRPAGALIDIGLLLFDEEAQARASAARALGSVGEAGAAPLLAIRLHVPDEPEVWIECMNSLAVLEEPRALDLISPHLNSPDAFLAAGAAMALARTRRSDALPALLKALDGADSDAVEPLAAAVATLRIPEARQALIDRTTVARRPLRAACVRALQGFPDDSVQEILKKIAAEDNDPAVRLAASESLPMKPQ